MMRHFVCSANNVRPVKGYKTEALIAWRDLVLAQRTNFQPNSTYQLCFKHPKNVSLPPLKNCSTSSLFPLSFSCLFSTRCTPETL